MNAEGSIEGTGGVRVSYTVKELLGSIDAKLVSIDTKLDLKADTRELERLAQRVEAQGGHINSLANRMDLAEKVGRDRDTRDTNQFTKREKTITLVIGAAAVLIPYLSHVGVIG